MRMNAKDIASGAFFALVGLAYLWMAVTGLPIGSALEMGPGYFPIILSGILVLFGVAIAYRGFMIEQETKFGSIPWRAVIMLSLATLVFAAFFDDLGLFPGVFVLAFLAALSSPQNSVLKATIDSLFIAAFCTGVFGYGIGLPIPLIGPLFFF
jgi:hypothetical protein